MRPGPTLTLTALTIVLSFGCGRRSLFSTRNLEFKDTEGRTFSGRCDTERWSDCTFAGSIPPAPRPPGPGAPGKPVYTYRPGNPYTLVCDTWQDPKGEVRNAEQGFCRPIVCTSADDCPTFGPRNKAPSCVGGLCGDAVELDQEGARILCLAGTGAPTSPPSPLQNERWANATDACRSKQRCTVPPECRQPTGLPPAPRDDRARADEGLPPIKPLREAKKLATLHAKPLREGLAIDGDRLYVGVHWSGLVDHESRLLRLPVSGGPLEKVASSNTFAGTLAAGGGTLVWLTSTAMGLRAGTAAPRELPLSRTSAIALDGPNAWVCQNDRILLVTLTDGKSQPLGKLGTSTAGGMLRDCHLTIDAESVYASYTLHDPNATKSTSVVERVSKKDGAASKLVEEKGARDVGVDAERIYWAVSGTSKVVQPGNHWTPTLSRPNPDGAIRVLAKTGQKNEPVTLASGEYAPRSVLVDARHVYWRSAHGIRRVSKAGGSAELVVKVDAPYDGDEQDFVADESNLYWVTEDGDLMTAPK